MNFLNNESKKVGSLLILLLVFAMPLYAQANILPTGMQNLADSILGIFTSMFVKVILAIMLCGSAVAYAFNKDNEKIKRNAIAVGISAAILVTASSVVELVWSASQG